MMDLGARPENKSRCFFRPHQHVRNLPISKRHRCSARLSPSRPDPLEPVVVGAVPAPILKGGSTSALPGVIHDKRGSAPPTAWETADPRR
jgi:hypothetical protein